MQPCSLSSSRCATRRRAPSPPRRGVPCLASSRGPAATAVRPGLADAVRRPGLDHRPPRRPGSADARRGRGGHRPERLHVRARRQPRRAGDRVRPPGRHRLGAAPGHRVRRPRHESAIDGWPRSPGRPEPAWPTAWRADRPAWTVAAATSLVILAIFWTNGWVQGPDGWVTRRLELERPARPRRDRLEHRRRQLPARGPVLRRRAADLPLVRRLPRGDRRDRGRRRRSSRSTS